MIGSLMQGSGMSFGEFNASQFVSEIEQGYLANNRNGFKVKKSFSPSALVYQNGGGSCPRRWFLSFRGGIFEEDNTSRQYANMINGTMSHERIQQAMQDAGVLVDREKEMVIEDPPFFGYCDANVEFNGTVVPVEIKTVNEVSFEYIKSSRRARDYHVGQLLIYMHVEQKPLGVVLYENKNTHELLAIPIKMTPERQEWVDETLDWCRVVYQSYLDDKMPAVPYRSNSKICRSCPLKSECDKAGTGRIVLGTLEQYK